MHQEPPKAQVKQHSECRMNIYSRAVVMTDDSKTHVDYYNTRRDSSPAFGAAVLVGVADAVPGLI